MELEELKKGWKMMDKQMDKLESENEAPVSRITQNRAVSSQQRLIREFQRMTSICLMTLLYNEKWKDFRTGQYICSLCSLWSWLPTKALYGGNSPAWITNG